ncbi:unnamed protein product [Phytophthora fragariaefolia]|uniref:Unnamed protein product n=1 Tax=Phytophthora fragariaefolia TaxID=1490495 RepID=A0A9W7D1M9_9STRA|nr:unnamed protein product [Phytophthora fragariaefolia]
MDLEEELMDLGSSELAYLPPNGARSSSRQPVSSAPAQSPTDQLKQQVAAQLGAQAVQTVALQQQNQRQNQILSSGLSSDAELLTPEQLQFLAEEEARLERRNAVARELMAARKVAIANRLDELVLQFEKLQRSVNERVNSREVAQEEEEQRRRINAQQMMAKLQFVVEQSALELQVVDEHVQWTRLLEELPMEERDYLSRAADERFVEQMKYLKGEREGERECLIQQHLHSILVLTAPQRNGQTVAKTSKHHSLRHLLEAFHNIFRGCYEGLLRYGGQGFGLRAGVSVDRVTCVLPLVAADVTQFAAILVQVVMFRYPFLQHSVLQHDAVQRCVIAALFDVMQPALHGLYVASFQREDAIVDDIAEVSRTNALAYFEIKPLFRLDGSWSEPQQRSHLLDGNERRLLSLRHYSAAIHHMNNLASERSPIDKLDRLSQVCAEIDQAVKAFYELQTEEYRPRPDQLNM